MSATLTCGVRGPDSGVHAYQIRRYPSLSLQPFKITITNLKF